MSKMFKEKILVILQYFVFCKVHSLSSCLFKEKCIYVLIVYVGNLEVSTTSTAVATAASVSTVIITGAFCFGNTCSDIVVVFAN